MGQEPDAGQQGNAVSVTGQFPVLRQQDESGIAVFGIRMRCFHFRQGPGSSDHGQHFFRIGPVGRPRP